MKENLKYLWFLLCTFIITIVLIVTNRIIYGTEKINIADYMPKIDLYGRYIEEEPWESVRFNRVVSDMKYAFIIGIALTIISMIILYKKKVLKKDAVSITLSLIMLVLPIIISGLILLGKYGYTC